MINGGISRLQRGRFSRRTVLAATAALASVSVLAQGVVDPATSSASTRSAHHAAVIPSKKPTSPFAGLPHVAKTPRGKRYVQLGVDVWWPAKRNLRTEKAVIAESRAIVKYVVGDLHANSMAISFPVFSNGLTKSRVYTTRTTPSPAELTVLIEIAHYTGLNIELRPLLELPRDEFRGYIQPANPHRFLMTYYYSVRPYLVLASQQHISTFIYATEWTWLSWNSKYAGWFQYMVDLFHHWYKGHLIYDESGAQYLAQRCITPECHALGYHTDAYFPVNLADNAKTGQLEFWWDLYMQKLSAHVRENTVFQEVGFDAIPGGFRTPADSSYPPTNTRYLYMQNEWFSMLCYIVHHFDVGGVYFWPLDFNVDPATTRWYSSRLSANDWVRREGAADVAACFGGFYRYR